MLLTCCSNDSDITAQTMTERLYITIDGRTLPVVLVDNAATQTLVAALQEGDITYEAHDYGGNVMVKLSLSSGTTAINGIRSTSAEDGAYYSLNGQRVEHPTKGTFIRNGKKVIIL